MLTTYSREELDRDAKSYAQEHAKVICGTPAKRITWSLSLGGHSSGPSLHIAYWATRKGASEPECFTHYVAI
mgnify:CR=1 FL=1